MTQNWLCAGVFHPHRPPAAPCNPLDNAPQVAALAALSNLPYIERVRDALVAERGRLFEGLQAVPFLQASRGGACYDGGWHPFWTAMCSGLPRCCPWLSLAAAARQVVKQC